jgi:hypothetical protein
MKSLSSSSKITRTCPITGKKLSMSLTNGTKIWCSTRTCFLGEIPENFQHIVGLETPTGYILRVPSGCAEIPFVYMFVSKTLTFFRLSSSWKFDQVRENWGKIALIHKDAKISGFTLPVVEVDPFLNEESLFVCEVKPYEGSDKYDSLVVRERSDDGMETYPGIDYFHLRVPKLSDACIHNGEVSPTSINGHVSIFDNELGILYVFKHLKVKIEPIRHRSEFLIMEEVLWM